MVRRGVPTIVILGGHTAVARALVECVEERELELTTILASPQEHLAPGLAPIDEALFAKADLFVLAFSGEVARALAEGARRLKKPLLDLAGAVEPGPRARWLWPGLIGSEGAALDPALTHLIPGGLAVPVLSALRALWPFGLVRADVVALESASAFDQPGMHELEEQVRAVLAMRDAEAAALPGALAFDVVPSLAAGPEDTFEAADRRLVDQLAAGLVQLGGARPELRVTRVLVPTFTADAAVLEVDVEDAPERAAVEDALKAARGLFFEEEEQAPSARAAIGRDDAVAGRLTVEGRRINLWVASDRLRRGSATLAALVLERWLEQHRLN